jgi:hypothetical protein
LSDINESNDRFLAIVVHDDELDLSRLQIEYGVGGIVLGENVSPLGIFKIFFPGPTFSRKIFGSNDAAVRVLTSVLLSMENDPLQRKEFLVIALNQATTTHQPC